VINELEGRLSSTSALEEVFKLQWELA